MDRQQILKNSSPANLPPAIKPLTIPKRTEGSRGKARFTPVSWDKYFDSKRTVAVKDDVFSVFQKGSEGPVLFLVHGGGFSALSWALFSKAITDIVSCQCIAADLRGHGDTATTNDEDLSAEMLANDVGNVMAALYPGADESPSVVLIGHSLGGAVCVHAASRNLVKNLVGLVVIDVVEGTALESLTIMESLVRGRPSTFPSVENATEWAFRSGHIKNPESACVSMIGQLKPISADATDEPVKTRETHVTDAISEETDEPKSETDSHPSNSKYTWRIDLLKTQPFWEGWFRGLSQMFLSCPVPKLLLLAGR